MKSTNPEGNKAINQKRGPTTGNAGSMSKRDTLKVLVVILIQVLKPTLLLMVADCPANIKSNAK